MARDILEAIRDLAQRPSVSRHEDVEAFVGQIPMVVTCGSLNHG